MKNDISSNFKAETSIIQIKLFTNKLTIVQNMIIK